jgi:MFS family permease
MYAFRKPFTVGLFENQSLLGVDYKIWLITFQVVGYTLSKFIGIKYVSELKPGTRALYILFLIAMAEIALLLFWVVPKPYNVLFMFFNGLPLGMIWGAVFSYLEGRKLTELLGAGLSASFIIASGVVKSVGELVIVRLHVTEFAMPFVTGLLFAVPLVVFVFLLDALPPPSVEDEKLRTRRVPMDRNQRKAFLRKFYAGIVLLVVTYTFLTVFRELRDNFSVELWTSLGYGGDPSIFTVAELPVALVTLLSLASVTFIRSNYLAFNVILLVVLAGFSLIIVSSLLFAEQWIGGKTWMILIGIGLYLGYVPFNAFLYERLISAFCYVSNIGFIMYLSDAFGYFGSLVVVFYKNFFSQKMSWVSFFCQSSLWFSSVGLVLVAISFLYFRKKHKQRLLMQHQVAQSAML